MAQEHRLLVQPLSHIPVIHPALFYSNGDGQFNWSIDASGADYVADYNADAAFVGAKGLRLHTKSTTPAIDDYVHARQRLWIPPTKILRFQAVIASYGASPDTQLAFTLMHYDGAIQRTAGVRLDAVDGTVYYWTSGAAWTAISALSWNSVATYWNKLDFAISIADGLYNRITLNHNTQDMSALAIQAAASATAAHLYLLISLIAKANAMARAHIDQILLTGESL